MEYIRSLVSAARVGMETAEGSAVRDCSLGEKRRASFQRLPSASLPTSSDTSRQWDIWVMGYMGH